MQDRQAGMLPGRRDSRKPRNTTALVETSDRLRIAVAARPAALTAMARLAWRRSG